MWATFDLTGLNPGPYDVRLDQKGQSARAAGAFTVDTGAAGRAEVTLRYGSAGRPEHRYAWRAGR